MSALFRRCGCRDEQGRQYGALSEDATPVQRERACPAMLVDPKHGRWSFRLSAGFDPVTKKRRQVNGGSYPTKREAQQERNKAAVAIDAGKVVTTDRRTFAEYLPAWLDRRAVVRTANKAPLRPATLENYRRYVEQDIGPSALGVMQLREIRRRHVQAFVDDLARTRGAVTVARIVAVVQGALSQAVVDELIDETPAHNLELPVVETREFEPWEVEQVGHFLDVAAQHRLGSLFEVAVFTGLRRGELLGLRWSDVDLTRRELRVQTNRTTTGEGRTKTEAGRRRVALDDRAVGALVAWQIGQAGERDMLGGDWTASGHVFTYADGQPLKPQYVTRLFDKLRIRACLPEMTLHGLRHQSASLQLAAGVPLAVVSKRLGHSSVSVTADIYSHLLRSTEHDAANAAAALVPARRVLPPLQGTFVGARAHTLHAQGGENEREPAPAWSGDGL